MDVSAIVRLRCITLRFNLAENIGLFPAGRKVVPILVLPIPKRETKRNVYQSESIIRASRGDNEYAGISLSQYQAADRQFDRGRYCGSAEASRHRVSVALSILRGASCLADYRSPASRNTNPASPWRGKLDPTPS